LISILELNLDHVWRFSEKLIRRLLLVLFCIEEIFSWDEMMSVLRIEIWCCLNFNVEFFVSNSNISEHIFENSGIPTMIL
jgi:hypothetical protein